MTDIDASTTLAQVLKRDVRGRVRTTRARRDGLLDEFERSGLSGPAFARVAGLSYQTFTTWRHQRRKQRSGTSGTEPPVSGSPSIVGHKPDKKTAPKPPSAYREKARLKKCPALSATKPSRFESYTTNPT